MYAIQPAGVYRVINKMWWNMSKAAIHKKSHFGYATLLYIFFFLVIISCSNDPAEELPDGFNDDIGTNVPADYDQCNSCHGFPPDDDQHTADWKNCHRCHPRTVMENGQIDVVRGYHRDGAVQYSLADYHPDTWVIGSEHGYAFYEKNAHCQSCHGMDYGGGNTGFSCDACHTGGTNSWRTDCTFCHGGMDNDTGAPPYGVFYEENVENFAVGSHTAHVMEGKITKGFDCSVCHKKPDSFDTPGHIDGEEGGEVKFNEMAGKNGTYDRTDGSCSSLYCHGNGIEGSSQISWTSNQKMACDSCHGYYGATQQSLSGHHDIHLLDRFIKCRHCHRSVIDENDTIIDKEHHINGKPEVNLHNSLKSTSASYNYETKTCVVQCHFFVRDKYTWD